MADEIYTVQEIKDILRPVSEDWPLSMKYNIPDRVLREIRSFAEENHIRKIILFGSRARGTNMPRSDIDLAVSGGDFDGFYWNIKENIHSLLSFDVIDMDLGITDELKNELKKDGVILYEKT